MKKESTRISFVLDAEQVHGWLSTMTDLRAENVSTAKARKNNCLFFSYK